MQHHTQVCNTKHKALCQITYLEQICAAQGLASLVNCLLEGVRYMLGKCARVWQRCPDHSQLLQRRCIEAVNRQLTHARQQWRHRL